MKIATILIPNDNISPKQTADSGEAHVAAHYGWPRDIVFLWTEIVSERDI